MSNQPSVLAHRGLLFCGKPAWVYLGWLQLMWAVGPLGRWAVACLPEAGADAEAGMASILSALSNITFGSFIVLKIYATDPILAG